MNPHIKVKTLYGDQTIHQMMEIHGMNVSGHIGADIAKRVMDLREQGVREALIKLGWTPPSEYAFEAYPKFRNINDGWEPSKAGFHGACGIPVKKPECEFYLNGVKMRGTITFTRDPDDGRYANHKHQRPDRIYITTQDNVPPTNIGEILILNGKQVKGSVTFKRASLDERHLYGTPDIVEVNTADGIPWKIHKVAAHRWHDPARNLLIGNWRDGDYDPNNGEERRLMNSGMAISRSYTIEESPQPIKPGNVTVNINADEVRKFFDQPAAKQSIIDAIERGRPNGGIGYWLKYPLKWQGIHKLTEECGELTQLLGKLAAFPSAPHPDGKGDLRSRVSDEVADVAAALDYFVETNNLNTYYIRERHDKKLSQFRKWGLEGTTP